MKWLVVFLIILVAVVVPVSADYALQVQALTSSPADGATNYIGNRPQAPTTTVNTNTIVIPTSGVINVAELYDYSGTAGTAEAYSYYIRLNNANDYLISTLTVNTSERVFTNSSMGIAVSAGDYFEIKRVHPTWATNPLTNIVGGYVLVNTSWTQPGYPVYGMALTNTVADTVTDYLGGSPVAPSTTEGINKIYVPTNGTITRVYANEYSGTAGTAESYSYYVNVNNTASLIQTQAVSSNLRLFENTNVGAGILKGNYLEFKRTHPIWATNPLTNIVGVTAFIDTSEEHIDGYPIWVEAITSSPTDGQTVYFGNRPIVPSTVSGTNKIYIRQDGTITRSEIYVYSGTAGSAHAWSLYVRVNNATDYLIKTDNSAASERIFRNTSQGIPVVAGDYVEIKGVQPTWTTNPLTTVYGGYLFLEYTVDKPVVSFTSNVTLGTVPTTVQFNDTSVTDITSWNWSYTNITPGNNTKIWWSTDQNPVQTFGAGTWQITLEATNASGSRESTKTHHISVSDSGGLSGWNRQDILMEGVYTLQLEFQDSVTHSPIPVVTVLDSVGGNQTTATATFTGSYNYSVVVVYITSEGYVATSRSYVMDEDRSATIYLVGSPEPPVPPVLNVFTMHPVRIKIVDAWGVPLPHSAITVNYLASTLPSTDTTWLASAFGISTEVAAEMVDSGLAMTGSTANDGALTFMMFPALTYGLTITNATIGLNNYQELSPRDTDYVIYCPLASQNQVNNTLTAAVASSLPFYQLNATGGYNLSMIYQDTAGYTTNLRFQVIDYTAGSVLVYDHDLGNPGTGIVIDNYTVVVPMGQEYIWRYNATKL